MYCFRLRKKDEKQHFHSVVPKLGLRDKRVLKMPWALIRNASVP